MNIQPASVMLGALVAESKTVQFFVKLWVLSWGLVKGVWWLARHPRYTIPAFMFFVSLIHFWSETDIGFVRSLIWACTTACMTSIVFVWWRLTQLLRHSEIDTWGKLFRGLPRLVHYTRHWGSYVAKLRPKLEVDGETPLFLAPTITHSGLAGIVDTSGIAKNSTALKPYEGDLAAALRCDRVIFEPLNTYEAAVRIDWGRHLAGTLSLSDVPEPTWTGSWPVNIAWGMTEVAGPAETAANESILVGGITGSGKSSFAWAYIAGWIKSGYPFRLRICDGSGMEFVELKKQLDEAGIVHDYVDGSDKEALEAFFKRAEKALDTRMAASRRDGVRLFIPTVKNPADILIVDETIPISEALREEGTEHPICRIAYLGRKASQIVVMLTQAGQKSVMGAIRDFFPRRISFRTANRPLAEVVLGESCEREGARCSSLHERHDRGVGWYARAGGYMQFRTPWVSDEDTKIIARGVLPDSVSDRTLLDQPTTLYRLWGDNYVLLYVGIAVTGREEARWQEHARDKYWWDEVVEKTTEFFPDRRDAKDAETIAIKREKPLYNIQENASGRGLNAYMKRLTREKTVR